MKPDFLSSRVRTRLASSNLAITFLLVLSLLLAGCSLGRQPVPAETTATPATSSQVQPTGSGSTPTQAVAIPGMPACPTPETTQAPATSPVAQPVVQPSTQVPPFVILSGGKLADGWSDASYGGTKAEYGVSDVTRDGKPVVKITNGEGWGSFSVADWNNSNIPDTSKYSHLHLWVHGGSAGGQQIGVSLAEKRVRVEKYVPGGKIQAGKWQEAFIPLEDLETGGQKLGRLTFQEVTGGAQPPYYIDGIEFYKDTAPPATPIVTQAELTVDVAANRRPISPYIYGMSVAPEEIVKEANASINRMGGNPYSRYNWTLGSARNAGSDWEFRNYSREGDDPAFKQPSGLADMFYKANKRAGAETLLTVPTLGYVAKDDNNETRSTGVPEEGGAPVSPGSEAIRGYDPKQNQQTTSVKSLPRKGAPFADPPNPNAGAVYQDEWINHLTRAFGKGADGGVRFYAMDNEPDLWADNTHVDVHPVRPGYNDMLRNFLDYAGAVKDVDPTAQVTGPVVSGWTGYWFSALDRGNDAFDSAPDRKAHGNMPLIPWFLQETKKADAASGRRTLDVLDIHYYPQAQGVYGTRVDPRTAALRLRSTRALWDPTYEDESWIARTEEPKVNLIPRMKGWIDQYYPGTRLGITEWNWGAEETMNGALAIADVLGIYGREGVYLATYFTNPPAGSPGLAAFKMYRNYDGSKATFGDTSVAAQSSNTEKLSIFASEDTKTNQIKIMVLNKTERESMATRLNLRGANLGGSAKVYQLNNAGPSQVQALPDAPLSGSTLSYTFLPYSITLLVIDKR